MVPRTGIVGDGFAHGARPHAEFIGRGSFAVLDVSVMFPENLFGGGEAVLDAEGGAAGVVDVGA